MSQTTKTATPKSHEAGAWAPMLLDAWMAPVRVLAWQQEQTEAVTLAWFERARTVRQDGERVYEAAAKRGVELLVQGEAKVVEAGKKMGMPMGAPEAASV